MNDFFLPLPQQGQEAHEIFVREFNAKKSMSHLSLAELIGQYRSVKNSLRDLEVQEKCLRDALILRSRDQSLEKYGWAVEKITRKSGINYSLIPELKEIDLERYRDKPIEYWKVSEIKRADPEEISPEGNISNEKN